MKEYKTIRICLMVVGLLYMAGCEPDGSSGNEENSNSAEPSLEVENTDSLCYTSVEGTVICRELNGTGVALWPEDRDEVFEPFELSSEFMESIKCSRVTNVKFTEAIFEYTGSVWVLKKGEEVVGHFEADKGIAFVKMDETLWCRSFPAEGIVLDLPGILYTHDNGCIHELLLATKVGTILINDDADDYLRQRPLNNHPEGKLTLVTELDEVTQGPEDFLLMQENQWELVWQGPEASVLTYAEGSIRVENTGRPQLIQFGNATLQYKIEGGFKALYTTPESSNQIEILPNTPRP